jgi:hypothetical protein
MRKTLTRISNIFYLSLIVSLSLLGCASYPITGHDLRDDPHGFNGMIEFSANDDYLTVYERIILASTSCYGTKPFRVDSELFKDNKTAEITIASDFVFYIAGLFISIVSTSNNKSHINVYYAPGLKTEWKAAAELIKKWAYGNTDVCR